MYLKPAFTISEDDVLTITREMGYGEAIENVDSVAQLFWEGDFMNSCYKELGIDDAALETAINDTAYMLDPEYFDEEYYEECLAQQYIIKALRKYCEENNIKTDSILVDVSW